MLTDPQQWNLYSYVRNNPLILLDPTGEAIELTGSAEERHKQLEALRQIVGAQAGAYLYENKVTTIDANGNEVTTYYVGIYTNGPDGNGPSFESINPASRALSGIINDQRVAVLNLVPAGTLVTNSRGQAAVIDAVGRGSPGATYKGQDGRWHITLLDTTATPPGTLPGGVMSDRKPGTIDAGILAGHEFGHLRYHWSHWFWQLLSSTNSESLVFENYVRKLRNPSAATRRSH